MITLLIIIPLCSDLFCTSLLQSVGEITCVKGHGAKNQSHWSVGQSLSKHVSMQVFSAYCAQDLLVSSSICLGTSSLVVAKRRQLNGYLHDRSCLKLGRGNLMSYKTGKLTDDDAKKSIVNSNNKVFRSVFKLNKFSTKRCH